MQQCTGAVVENAVNVCFAWRERHGGDYIGTWGVLAGLLH